MVTFFLAEGTLNKLVYWYYPEGDQAKKPGVIVYNKNTNEIKIVKLAEEDWEYEIPIEDLNNSIEFINQGKIERGETDLLGPATEPIHNIYYGGHAVSEIQKYLNKGVFPSEGRQIWY